jgi:arylsulfatase A-like enzyme
MGMSLPEVAHSAAKDSSERPNLVFIFADQWRAQSTGYASNRDVKTPHLDKLAGQSINFTNAVSGCPVCSPYRASLLTGQYWLTHGIFYNDKPLDPEATTIGKVYSKAGYETGYIGKWHVDGQGRTSFIPRERRQGFKFWKALECTPNSNRSLYYGDTDVKRYWNGYDAVSQTREAEKYIRRHAGKSPLNSLRKAARQELAGYYAHIAVLDDCIADLLKTIRDSGIEDNTIFVFTSDHGDMLRSHGQTKKQKPWDESVRVPFLVRYPAAHGKKGRQIDMPVNTPDIMPTLLGLSGIDIPESVEGRDFSGVIRGTQSPDNDAALIACPVPFHQWSYGRGGREYRGVRTRRYTYTRDLNGPWLLYDNKMDPHQLRNLCNNPEYAKIQDDLEKMLARKLKETNDKFLPGPEYMAMWNYTWDGSDGRK